MSTEPTTSSFSIQKRSGELQPFSKAKLQAQYTKIAQEYSEECPFEELFAETEKYFTQGTSTKDILSMCIKSAINLISIENTARQYIAGRLAMGDLYKQAGKNRNISLEEIYSPQSYLKLFEDYVATGKYAREFWEHYTPEDILQAAQALNKDQDMQYNYTTVLMLKKRYLLNPNQSVYELPQEMYLSIGLFLAIPEKKEERVATAIKIYHAISSQKISLPTPTLMNARTNFHQLSSCFKLNLDDDLRSIYHNIENMAQISKFGGGIGAYLGNIRAKGSEIRGVKGASGGVIPWVKVINDTAIAVNQLGARAGAISVTLDIRHKDMLDFLSIQTETGDIRRKSFDIFPAVTIPDIFMQRVQEEGEWTLMDPKEIEDITGERLQDFFGEAFTERYQELEKNPALTFKHIIPAKELMKTYLKSVVETGMPYAFFRDTVNRANPNRHVGNIYSSQLCTEIAQNTSPSKFLQETQENGKVSINYQAGDTVVCNLASINIAKVHTSETMEEIIPIAMRILDNVITLNFYPVKESEITAKKYRSVGLGFLGLAEYLATNNMVYDSPFARDHVEGLFEHFAFHTLQASQRLAQARGKYELFEGSDRSKGILFGKDEAYLIQHTQLKEKRGELIQNIKRDGVRFGYHLSPAPNTSTSLVVGTTAGLLPIYRKYFVETNSIAPSVNVAPKLSTKNMRYYKEYAHMKMPEVINMIAGIQKRIDQSISFEWIIDPSQVSPKELFDYYFQARNQGIKTIYYVRSMSLDVKECISCSG